MGFEALVTLTEETKNATRTIAKAIIFSVIITSIIYVLVAITAVSTLDWKLLGSSSAPMADVAAASMGNIAFLILGIIALFSTANTVLIQSITSSRLIYGMACDKALPAVLKKVSRSRKTPVIAIGAVTVLTILFVWLKNMELVANITTLFLFATFATINTTVVILRYKEPNVKRPFKIPCNIGKFQVLAFCGALSSLFLLYFSLTNIISIVG
jgi:APA family basic amino acid/polyamine antiporter